jgi:hypothetical protein
MLGIFHIDLRMSVFILLGVEGMHLRLRCGEHGWKPVAQWVRNGDRLIFWKKMACSSHINHAQMGEMGLGL